MEKRVLSDFQLGEWKLERIDLKMPAGSVSALTDAYVDRSGVPRGRGRVTQKITTALTNLLGELIWAGTLLPGRRAIVYSDNGGVSNASSQRFDPATAAFAGAASGGVPMPKSYAVVGNTLWLAGPQGAGTAIYHWGGSLKASQVGVTNVQRTVGSKVITRAAGGFVSTGNFDVGMIIRDWSSVGGGPGVVASIDSDTQITMDRPSGTTVLGSSTFFGPPVQALLIGTALQGGGTSVVGAVAGRLLILEKNRLVYSRGPDPATGGPRTEQYQIGDQHEFPVDAVGVAMSTLRDRVMIFTQAGNYAVSGMAYEIVDGSGNPQHPIEQISSKSVALSQKGIVSWQGALIVPCRDGIYVMDGYGEPVLLSRNVPWAELVRDGLDVGFATVYKERYILPYRYGGETHQLVFRTDGRDTEFGSVFSLSTFSLPGNPFAVTTDTQDSLLACGAPAAGVLQLGEVFSETGDGQDYDGGPAAGSFMLTTGPIALGDKGTVRRVRVRYTWKEGTATASAILAVRVTADDGARFEEEQITIDQSAPTKWVAVDFTTPVESDKVVVDLYLLLAKPSGFAVQAVEVQYRAFGGV